MRGKVFILFYLTITVINSASQNNTDKKLELIERILEWIRSSGGSINEKIKLNKKSLDVGFYTESNIKQNEILATIPPNCLIEAARDNEEEEAEDDDDVCRLAEKLLVELKLKSESEYSPYIEYLFNMNGHGIPKSTVIWSTKGREVLDLIIGKELAPHEITDIIKYKYECSDSMRTYRDGSNFDESMEDLAYELANTRNWDGMMIPIIDMMDHRNGKWTNVDVMGDERNLVLYATRSIQKDEKLYLSYNECMVCETEWKTEFVTQHILQNYGFTEEYPRRWVFFEDFGDSLVMSFDHYNGKFHVEWLSKSPPHEGHKRVLHGHWKRQKDLWNVIYAQVETIPEYEKQTVLNFYNAQLEALEMAIFFNEEQNDCNESKCHLDDLVEEEFHISYEEPTCIDTSFEEYEDLAAITTQYQSLHYLRNPKHEESHQDTCLHMDGTVHVCQSLRPNYHEVMVHFPATFLPELKRVIFLGGGDSMLLHEILKYPSLELVVGLELDIGVVQSSFDYFHTLPHFDNPKVQWWFGDAAKSLTFLRNSEYIGTFDLVVIDLLSDVIENLYVTDKTTMTIMDAALTLLHENGVFIRNVDFGFELKEELMQYELDIFYIDFPYFCHNGFTIGSNGRHFLKEVPIDHGIENIYYHPSLAVHDETKRFDRWYNFRQRNTTNNIVADNCCMKLQEASMTKNEDQFGVLLILEAEGMSNKLDLHSFQRVISETIQQLDLKLLNVQALHNNDVVFFMKEAYILSRIWPDDNYYSFDLLFWDKFDKQEKLKISLLHALGTTKSSSFRIVTKGGFQTSKTTEQVSDTCICHDTNQKSPLPHGITQDTKDDNEMLDNILSETVSFMLNKTNLIIILCGRNHFNSCMSKKELLASNNVKENIAFVTGCAENDAYTCYKELSEQFITIIKTKNVKIECMLILPSVDHFTGKVIHKLYNNTFVRRQLFADEHVILQASFENIQDDTWRRALLDSFRTSSLSYNPSFHANVKLEQETNHQAAIINLGIYSAGDDSFFHRLTSYIKLVENKYNIHTDVHNVINGVYEYIPEFKPSKLYTFDDYDQTLYRLQKESQQILARQIIFHLELKPNESELTLSNEKLRIVMKRLLEAMSIIETYSCQLESKEKGTFISCSWTEGAMVAIWNGANSFFMDVLSYSTKDKDLKTNLTKMLLREIPQFMITYIEEIPRGIGSIVSFSS